MTILERLKRYPGFLYQIGQSYYFLGKWICKPCTELEITDCHAMYNICSSAGETSNTALYFQKLRAYSDFALDIPYNQAKIHENLAQLLEQLTAKELDLLAEQLEHFFRDYERFCGPLSN